MNNIDFDLDYDLMLMTLSTNNKSYDEFYENIEILDNVYKYINESVNDNSQQGLKKKIGNYINKGVNNTKNFIGGALTAYDKVTDIGGNLIKGVIGVIGAILKSIYKVITWIIGKISNLGKAITGLGKKSKIASVKIKNKKINDMFIFITASDIAQLYNDKLFNKIDRYIVIAKKACEKGYWNINKIANIFKQEGGDIKLLNNLQKLYNDFKSLEFKEESISLKDQNNIDIYFSGTSNIDFIDLKGNKFSGNYYQALLLMLEDLKYDIQKIKTIHSDLYSKYENNVNNSSFGNLEKDQQIKIQNSISTLGKTTSILGKMFNYIMHDVKSINEVVNEVLNNDKSKIKNADKIKENINKNQNNYKNNTSINI